MLIIYCTVFCGLKSRTWGCVLLLLSWRGEQFQVQGPDITLIDAGKNILMLLITNKNTEFHDMSQVKINRFADPFCFAQSKLKSRSNVKLHTNFQIYGITWWSQGPINMTIPYAYIVGLSNIKHVEIWIDHFKGIHFQFC